MKILKTLGLSLLGFSLIAGFFIYRALAFEDNTGGFIPAYRYKIITRSPDPHLEPGEPEFMKVTIKNTGSEGWPASQLFLGSVYFDGNNDRDSRFATSEWINGMRIKPSNLGRDKVVRPYDRASFNIPIRAVSQTGIYKESFRPVLEHTSWIDGKPIEWLVQVGSELSHQSLGEKQIQISLDDQRLIAIENHIVVLDTPISSGKAGYSTPEDLYKVLNHIDTAYSSEYGLYMDNWMALSSLKYGYQGYGLHALPFWKVNPARYEGREGEIINGRFYTQGKLYEDYTHLGEKRSHGCVRIGINAAKALYDWAENGTLVEIV